MFLIVDIRASDMKHRIWLPIALFALDEAVRGGVDLARVILLFMPRLRKDLRRRLGIDVMAALTAVAGFIPELRACGRLDLVQVESEKERVSITLY